MLAPAPGEHQAEVATPAGSGPDSPGGNLEKGTRSPVPSRLLRGRRLWAVAALLVLVGVGVALIGPHVRAGYHLHAARTELQRHHNRQAIQHLQACLRTWPSSSEALLLAARAARRAHAYDEADRCLQKYYQVRGLDEAGGFEQLLLAVQRNVDDHLVAQCRHHVEQEHPDTILILEALAQGYLRHYRLPEARFCLNLWLERQPDNPQALCLMGQFHLDYERAPDRSIEKYRRAVQLDPDHEEARLGLAVALLESRGFAEAAPHLEHLRQSQPDNLRVQVGLAECRYALDESDEAHRLLDRALTRQPEFAPALALRGRLALESGEHRTAETWLRQAVRRAPSDHQARYNLIRCLNHNDKAREAQQHEKWLRQREQDVKRFHEIVTRDLAKSPRDPALHCTLGELLLRSGHEAEGLRWLDSALRQNPQFPPARRALAEYRRKRKTLGGKDEQPSGTE